MHRVDQSPCAMLIKALCYVGHTHALCLSKPDTHYLLLQLVAVAKRTVAGLGAVVIDRLDRQTQEMGYILRVGNAQTDERKNAQFG